MLLPQQAANQLGGDDLGGAAEEGVGEELGGRGGYGNGFCVEVLTGAGEWTIMGAFTL